MRLGIERSCVNCKQFFRCCQKCWHCQRYCSPECRKRVRQQRHRKTNQKYSKTDRGREKNRLRQRRHRNRDKSKNTVTDHSTAKDQAVVEDRNSLLEKVQICSWCGQWIEFFVKEREEDELGIGKYRGPKAKDNYFSFIRFRQTTDGFSL